VTRTPLSCWQLTSASHDGTASDRPFEHDATVYDSTVTITLVRYACWLDSGALAFPRVTIMVPQMLSVPGVQPAFIGSVASLTFVLYPYPCPVCSSIVPSLVPPPPCFSSVPLVPRLLLFLFLFGLPPRSPLVPILSPLPVPSCLPPFGPPPSPLWSLLFPPFRPPLLSPLVPPFCPPSAPPCACEWLFSFDSPVVRPSVCWPR
jgi:hypothetical protein